MKLKELHEAKERSVFAVMGKVEEDKHGDFMCYGKRLTSLEGCPRSVSRNFICMENMLTSLEGCPASIKMHFNCSNNRLPSLEGGPSIVGGSFFCSTNKLTSLKGAPSEVGGCFSCSSNELTSLEGLPSSIGLTHTGNFECVKNQLTSLHEINKKLKYIGGTADFRSNPIKTHVLGLMLIRGLTKVYLDVFDVAEIINKHLEGDRDIFACQTELVEAGFEEFAQL